MITWNNLDTLESFKELSNVKKVNLVEAMTGENGAERVKKYSVPMAAGLAYNYAAKQVDDDVLEGLKKLAKEAQLTEKYAALYNGEMINTGEKRLVLHQLTRGQLGDTVTADGVDKRAFYVEQQQKIADFANKVHAGEITNAAGEKFTTVVQIGIGGSDLGPRAMYLALENWAKKNDKFKMEAKFISNVDPDDAAAVLNSIDVAHSIFVLVSADSVSALLSTEVSSVDGCSVWLAEFPQAASPKNIVKESKIAIAFFIINTSINFYSAREKMTSSSLSRLLNTERSEVTLPIGITSTERIGSSGCA